VDALAGSFIELGLNPGDRVVLQLPNVIEAPLTLLRAWRAGLVVAAVPMLWRAMEIARVRCGRAQGPDRPLAVCRRPAGTTLARHRRHAVRFVLGFSRELPDGITSLEAAMGAGRAHDVHAQRIQSGPSLITFSG
jgi:mycobactin salicyl-AMP ligase